MRFINSLAQRFPYRGIQAWALSCALLFIAAQFLWTVGREFRHIDWLEVPFRACYFPLAAFFDRASLFTHNPHHFLYALMYWLCLFWASLGISAKRINPIVPATLILGLSAIAGIVYEILTTPKMGLCQLQSLQVAP